MKNNIKAIVFGALLSSVVMIAGCATNSSTDEPKVDNPLTNIDLSVYSNQPNSCSKITVKRVEQCTSQGGALQRAGMLGCYTCIIEFSDAGKKCQDTSDCQGDCKVVQSEFYQPGTGNVSGQCAKNNNPFGCYQKIKNGIAQNALCVD